MKLNIIFQYCHTRCRRTTQEDSPSIEDTREVDKDEEDEEAAVEPKVDPTIRTTVPKSSKETVRT